MRGKSISKPSGKGHRSRRGRADLSRLHRMTEAQIARTSPPELADLPENFWDDAQVVVPEAKQAISLRVDREVLEWFRRTGPRYQTRINAILRTFMNRMQKRAAVPEKTHRR